MPIKKFAAVFIALLVISGCSARNNSSVKKPEQTNPKNEQKQESIPQSSLEKKIAGQGKIHKFANLEDVGDFLQENQITSNTYGTWGRGMLASDSVSGAKTGIMEKAEAVPTANESTKEAASSDYSKTNVQVEGVDESDIVKTDGKYIYALVKDSVYIINAYPTENIEIISKIQFKSRPQDMYVNGKNLVVFGYDNEIYQKDLMARFIRRNNYFFVKVFDLSDPKNPTQVRDLDFEGSYTDSRMIGDYLYLVTTNYNHYFIEDEPILPRLIEDGEVVSDKCAENAKCIAPDVYYFDIPYDTYNFTSIASINVKDNKEAIKSDVYLLSGSQNIYASLNNLYVTYTKYISEYELEMEITKDLIMTKLSTKDKDRISKIELADNFILSKDEKINKINQIIQRYIEKLPSAEQEALEKELSAAMKKKYVDISKELEKTVIHKIAIDKGNIEYKTFGEVSGYVLNQFSMDESGGYFRIATTKNQTWSRFLENQGQSYSNLFVLDADLKIVGSLEGLAKNERIYSVRFMQNRAYMVTFKQTDPLFAIDLKDPQNPRIMGELKIPGFSNYLHPYDENTLIGIGKDTEENENGGVVTKGIKISLFDVADIANPKESDTYILGDAGSDSIALYDHKAFLFSKEKNLMVIPVSLRKSSSKTTWGDVYFSGAAAFNIDGKKIELKGKIDHSDGKSASNPDYWMGYDYYDNTVKRSLYIDNTLYTLSNYFLKANDLRDLTLIKNLELEKQPRDFEVIN
jgi:uncharacterized secreted protein with C-terminal beta-propeller domain